MEFFPTRTDPEPGALIVCRQVRWNVVVLLAVLWAVPAGIWIASAPRFMLGLSMILPVLLTWPLLTVWQKRSRADNWVLAVHRNGLWLNLRDAEYHEAEPAMTVVFVRYSEILSARRAVHRYTTPSGSGDTVQHRDVFLELRLEELLAAKLRSEVAAERNRELPERQYLAGFVTSRSRRTHSLVEAHGNDRVRIRFSSSTVGIRPSLKRTLNRLSQFIAIDADETPEPIHWRELDGAALDMMVRRLAGSGQVIDAVNLLERRKSLSTTEARQYMDALSDT